MATRVTAEWGCLGGPSSPSACWRSARPCRPMPTRTPRWRQLSPRKIKARLKERLVEDISDVVMSRDLGKDRYRVKTGLQVVDGDRQEVGDLYRLAIFENAEVLARQAADRESGPLSRLWPCQAYFHPNPWLW